MPSPTIGPQIRHAAGELLAGAVTDNDARYLDGMLRLVRPLHLDPETSIAVADRLMAVTTLANIMIRGLAPEGPRTDLARMIQFATDNANAWDVLKEVTDG